MDPQAPVLDTMVLQAFVFGHPEGTDILLSALGAAAVRFPAEVYARDEGDLPDEVEDATLSEFARGIRWARRKVRHGPSPVAARCAVWLANLPQLHRHLDGGTFYIDALTLDELPLREQVTQRFGIGRGEAACLVLSSRSNAASVFISSDEQACKAARELGLPFITIFDVLMAWIRAATPRLRDVDDLLHGLEAARFALPPDQRKRVRALAGAQD